MEEYTPKIIEKNYVEMLIEGEKCKTCDRLMLPNIKRGLFPNYLRINQDAQMKRAGMVYLSSTQVDGKTICKECESAGKADFLCALCNNRYPSSEVKESIGWPAEFLCKNC
jgi:tRNA(Ile2) C34 agmatinyltransferase TiaS